MVLKIANATEDRVDSRSAAARDHASRAATRHHAARALDGQRTRARRDDRRRRQTALRVGDHVDRRNADGARRRAARASSTRTSAARSVRCGARSPTSITQPSIATSTGIWRTAAPIVDAKRPLIADRSTWRARSIASSARSIATPCRCLQRSAASDRPRRSERSQRARRRRRRSVDARTGRRRDRRFRRHGLQLQRRRARDRDRLRDSRSRRSARRRRGDGSRILRARQRSTTTSSPRCSGSCCCVSATSACIAADQQAQRPDNEYLGVSQQAIRRALPELAIDSVRSRRGELPRRGRMAPSPTAARVREYLVDGAGGRAGARRRSRDGAGASSSI